MLCLRVEEMERSKLLEEQNLWKVSFGRTELHVNETSGLRKFMVFKTHQNRNEKLLIITASRLPIIAKVFLYLYKHCCKFFVANYQYYSFMLLSAYTQLVFGKFSSRLYLGIHARVSVI